MQTEDVDYAAIAAGIELIKRANRAIETRKYTDRIGAAWHSDTELGYEPIPTRNGVRGHARLYATDDGRAYAVHTYTYGGETLHEPAVRKTLDAALRLGERLTK
ncbi:hypothetical protein AB0942_33200 [Streptomyces nodosus]|uniref:hypothetical protein n=1 Tax=Streptomyces nodosus TaxID=40318 RepID=UPI0034556D69